MSLNNYPIESMIASVRPFLKAQPSSVGEYAIIQHLSGEGFFNQTRSMSASLALFHKHFVTKHVLYLLQDRLRDEGYSLRIGALAIELQPVEAEVNSQSLSHSDQYLRDYYLDWWHLEVATDETVATLLRGFWRDFKVWQNSDQAYLALGLKTDATWPEVRRAYRQRIHTAHPDKGGQAADFAEIRDAYLSLKQKFRK